MTLETKFEDFKQNLDSQFSSQEVYLVLANYLLTALASMSNVDDTTQFKYSYNDLLDYNYVLEYLKYNPRDEVLVLAHTIHSLLFLYNTGNTNDTRR